MSSPMMKIEFLKCADGQSTVLCVALWCSVLLKTHSPSVSHTVFYVFGSHRSRWLLRPLPVSLGVFQRPNQPECVKFSLQNQKTWSSQFCLLCPDDSEFVEAGVWWHHQLQLHGDKQTAQLLICACLLTQVVRQASLIMGCLDNPGCGMSGQ